MINVEKLASVATRIVGYLLLVLAFVCFVMVFFNGFRMVGYSAVFFILSQFLFASADEILEL